MCVCVFFVIGVELCVGRVNGLFVYLLLRLAFSIFRVTVAFVCIEKAFEEGSKGWE